MNPRFSEAVIWMHPEIRWAGIAPADYPFRLQDDGAGPYVAYWNDAVLGPQPNDAQVDAALQQKDTRKSSLTSNTDRTDLIDALYTKTNQQIDTFIRGKINAASITDQASAVACIKRVENAIVLLAQALARVSGARPE